MGYVACRMESSGEAGFVRVNCSESARANICIVPRFKSASEGKNVSLVIPQASQTVAIQTAISDQAPTLPAVL